jgi:UDP-3-O-[3-hydroxymyristoyl] glucosamine N-acyltransferase
MEFTAQQIASFLHGTVVGNPDVKVSNVSKIEEGQPGTLTFLANMKYAQFIYTTQASIVLVNKSFVPEAPVAATMIQVDDAYACIAMLLNMVSAARQGRSGREEPSFVAEGVVLPEDYYIGAYAYISRGVKLGNNVKIYPQVYLGDNVTVGDNVILYPGVKVYHDCVIGNGCTLHAGVVIGADGFGFAPTGDGYEKIAQIGNVVLEDDVEIGANTTVDRATMGSTRIHRGTKLDNLVQIGHNVEIGESTVLCAQVGVAGSTKIGSHCTLAGQVGVAGHIHVGDHVTVGAQSGIPNNVKENQVLMGYPAVPARDFARQTVMIKQLGQLRDQVKQLEKQIAALQNEQQN